MRTAYAVGLLEADPESPLGVRLAGIDVFSEPSPTVCGRERVTFVLASREGDTFEEAIRDLLTHIAEFHPWLAKAFNGRTQLPVAGGDA